MRAIGLAAILLTAAAPIPAQFDGLAGGSVTFERQGGGWAPALLICDGTNRDAVQLVGAPDRRGRAMLASYAEDGSAPRRTAVRIGPGDPGAGQIYYALTDVAGTAVGTIHAVNPGMVDGATTPLISSLMLRGAATNCRWAPQTRVLGFTARRSIQVTGTGLRGYRYQSFNFDEVLAETNTGAGHQTRASVTVDGGRVVSTLGQRTTYEFRRGGYVYQIVASADPRRPGGGVRVLQGGRVLQTELFAGYTATTAP